ncbi:MAG: bis(5'-nucleosyl)-tetraphosphatase (symmetrical) YqeK [bacterium]|nr:bis(5'-nucleosyl)-tetraphosphatase (symmetrical) YqeK [bacterium]
MHLVQPLLDRLRQVLSEARMLHALGVTHVSCALAALHGLNVEHAAIAGLLHDQSKELAPDFIRTDLQRLSIHIPDEDLDFPSTWHGFHAAAVAQAEYGINEPDILQAVMLHTTGDAGMGPLAQALFIADFAEPCRRRGMAPAVLQTARRSLEEGFALALQAKARHMLGRKGFRLHPKALRALKTYLPRDQWQSLLAGDGTGSARS